MLKKMFLETLILTISVFIPVILCAQNDIPFIKYFGDYGEERVLKNDSTGYLFIPKVDTSVIIFISKGETDYKMYDRNFKLVSEGSIRRYVNYYKRFGKWTYY